MKPDPFTTIQPAVIQARRSVRTPLPERVPETGIYGWVFKRVFDLSISLLLLVLILSWLLPLLFVLVRLDSKGPFFFIQKRVGYRGRIFSCFKIRSMRPVRESDPRTDDALRITRVGWWLRLTHIDELPQLFNVIRNDMSLVGPRPHMLSHDARFALLIPEYSKRRLVRPGITGLAQAQGFHGETSSFFSIAGRTRLDLFYVRKRSAKLDFAILGKTLLVVPSRIFNRINAADDSR